MIRVGVEERIGPELLAGFHGDLQVVRIPEDPGGGVEIDFWIVPMSAKTARRQWPHLRGVRVVQCLSAGVDSVRGYLPPDVILCDGRGVHDIPTAEWAVAAVLAMQKYLPLYCELQTREDWGGRRRAEQLYFLSHERAPGCEAPLLVDEVADLTVLILGYGSIGAAVEARLAPFGARFLRLAREAKPGVHAAAALDELLPQADIVVICAPLTSETRHMLNAARLARMKRGALLVNAGRGPVVETDALVRALEEGSIRAALDVTDPEPLPPGHPLWKAPNLLLTPHVAGGSAKFLGRALKLAAEQARRLGCGESLRNVVSGEY